MALIKCPECGKDVSTSAQTCPHCGYQLKKQQITQTTRFISYEQQVVKIRCWGRDPNKLNKKLLPYTNVGWEVVSIVEDYWQGGILSPVYKMVLRRPRRPRS